MREAEGRDAIVKAAVTWLRTPYRHTGCLKGAGANCAMLLYGIARDAGVLPPNAEEPKWYSPQFHVHSKEERLLRVIESYGCVEISEAEVKPGDVIAYLTGRSHGHLALVIEWPRKIVQTTQLNGCQYAHARDGRLGASSIKFFSLWPRSISPEKAGSA